MIGFTSSTLLWRATGLSFPCGTILVVVIIALLTACGGGEEMKDDAGGHVLVEAISPSEFADICRDETIRELVIRDSPELKSHDLRCITSLRYLKKLFLTDCGVGDEGASSIAQVEGLETLNLRNGNLSDAGVRELARMPNLSQLHLGNNVNVTDDGLNSFLGHPSLQILVLDGCLEVTDRSVDLFKRIPHLKYLRVRGTRLSSKSVQSLREHGIDVSD